MIKEKYQHFGNLSTSQLLLHAKFGGITTIDDTQSLEVTRKKRKHAM